MPLDKGASHFTEGEELECKSNRKYRDGNLIYRQCLLRKPFGKTLQLKRNVAYGVASEPELPSLKQKVRRRG